MYIEQLYKLVDRLVISEGEKYKFNILLREASYAYLRKKELETLENYLIFGVEGVYIEQQEIYDILGIFVEPKIWKCFNYDSLDEEKKECGTKVIFPTKLFKESNKVLIKVI